jgi:hypothetical protein
MQSYLVIISLKLSISETLIFFSNFEIKSVILLIVDNLHFEIVSVELLFFGVSSSPINFNY